MNLISGGLGERSKPLVLETSEAKASVSSNLTPSTVFATEAEALTSAPAINHAQPKPNGSKQPKLYASRCVSQIGAQQWTNNRKENNAAW